MKIEEEYYAMSEDGMYKLTRLIYYVDYNCGKCGHKWRRKQHDPKPTPEKESCVFCTEYK
jgi:hypothetical protein